MFKKKKKSQNSQTTSLTRPKKGWKKYTKLEMKREKLSWDRKKFLKNYYKNIFNASEQINLKIRQKRSFPRKTDQEL